MSDAETRWANQQEWAEERARGFDVEINDVRRIAYGQGEICHMDKCNKPAVKLYEIKAVGAQGNGHDVLLCVDHDSEETAFKLYEQHRG